MARDRSPDRARRYRCPRCLLHRSLCLCDLLPRLTTRTRVVLVIHQLELRKTTSTGRLAALCLPGSTVWIRGDGDRTRPEAATASARAPAPVTPPWVDAAAPLLLFPHQDAAPLTQPAPGTPPATLVVPDGTWRQASRARHRLPGLDRIPCAALPAQTGVRPPRLRHDHRPERISTLEALARALGVLEGPEVERALLHILQVMVDRTLWSHGRLSTEQVTGGIPAGVRPHDPLGPGDR